MHRGVHRGDFLLYRLTLRDLLRYTAEGIISLLKGEEAEMLSPKYIIHMKDRGWMKISHTTPEEAEQQAEDLEELFG